MDPVEDPLLPLHVSPCGGRLENAEARFRTHPLLSSPSVWDCSRRPTSMTSRRPIDSRRELTTLWTGRRFQVLRLQADYFGCLAELYIHGSGAGWCSPGPSPSVSCRHCARSRRRAQPARHSLSERFFAGGAPLIVAFPRTRRPARHSTGFPWRQGSPDVGRTRFPCMVRTSAAFFSMTPERVLRCSEHFCALPQRDKADFNYMAHAVGFESATVRRSGPSA